MVARAPAEDLAAHVEGLMKQLAHRGPDGVGFWIRGGGSGRRTDAHDGTPTDVVLGHRRLSIVDVAGGAQPMSNEDETLWVSFNGEIYNHTELRQLLEAAGHKFATRCDTEVLLHGWEEWGVGLLSRLNGIFAFALADSETGEVVLARDPMGVKPLYVGVSGERTWWASEINAARAAGVVDGSLSAEAVKLYLTFRFVPSPWTIYRNVIKVPPSHLVRLRPADAGTLPTPERFESNVHSSALPRGRREWREALAVELEAAVQRQLMADVPVASLLSGGVDSSLVTLFMRRHLPYALQSYGIGFASRGVISEAAVAGRAADLLGTPHTSTVVSTPQYLAAWRDAARRLGEPIANTSGPLIQMLCGQVAQRHKVVLTGQGADEPLGGYPRHMVERLYPLARFAPGLSSSLVSRFWGRDEGRRLSRSLAANARIDRYIEIFAVLPLEETDRYVDPQTPAARELARAAVGRWLCEADAEDPVNGLLRVDSRMSLADDLLLIGDHFSMAESVELRVPFLDLAFVDLVERMPSRYKISYVGSRKWLYRQAARAILPRELARGVTGARARLGRKLGFTTPLDEWFASPNGPLASPASWSGAFAVVSPLSHSLAAELVEGGSPLLGQSRHRAMLYALALWAESSIATAPHAQAVDA